MKKMGVLLYGGIFLGFALITVPVVSHGPSIDERFLDEMNCSSGQQIHLDGNKTLVIKMSRRPANEARDQFFYNFECAFSVTTRSTFEYVMAVVQRLNTRISSSSSWAMLSTCTDTITLESKYGHEGIPICGEIQDGDREEFPMGLSGHRASHTSAGLLVDIKFGGPNVPEQKRHKPFQLELSFTQTHLCSSEQSFEIPLRHCSRHDCISENLICDGVVNCGISGKFGIDEANCASKVTSSGSQVLQQPPVKSISRPVFIKPSLPPTTPIPPPQYYSITLAPPKMAGVNHNDRHPKSDTNGTQLLSNQIHSLGTTGGAGAKEPLPVNSENAVDGIHIHVQVHTFGIISAIAGGILTLLVSSVIYRLGRRICCQGKNRQLHLNHPCTIPMRAVGPNIPIAIMEPVPIRKGHKSSWKSENTN